MHTGISFARRAGRKSYIVFGSRDLSYGIMWGAFSICRSLLFMHFLLRGVVRQGMLIKEPLEQLEQLELPEPLGWNCWNNILAMADTDVVFLG